MNRTTHTVLKTMIEANQFIGEWTMSFQWPWIKRKEIKLYIYDYSKRGEVMYVMMNQTKIAFPAHSIHAIRSLIDTLSDALGYTYTMRKCEETAWEITICK